VITGSCDASDALITRGNMTSYKQNKEKHNLNKTAQNLIGFKIKVGQFSRIASFQATNPT